MKVFGIIVKILIALVAVAGAVYIAATYGDKIVAWAKKMLGKIGCCCGCDCDCDCDCECDCECECDCCDETVEEAPAAEVPAEETASDADFEG